MAGSQDGIRSCDVEDISRIGGGRRTSDASAMMTMNSRYLSSRPDVSYGLPDGFSKFLSKNYGGGKSKAKQMKTSK